VPSFISPNFGLQRLGSQFGIHRSNFEIGLRREDQWLDLDLSRMHQGGPQIRDQERRYDHGQQTRERHKKEDGPSPRHHGAFSRRPDHGHRQPWPHLAIAPSPAPGHHGSLILIVATLNSRIALGGGATSPGLVLDAGASPVDRETARSQKLAVIELATSRGQPNQGVIVANAASSPAAKPDRYRKGR
jgi:hypothetical protein